MGSSSNISKWKEKAEVDYFAFFIPLWLSFNSWFKEKYEPETKDRIIIDKIKTSITNKIYSKFSDYYVKTGEESLKAKVLKSHLGELFRALENASLKYQKSSDKLSFRNALIERNEDGNNKKDKYENILKESGQKNKIKIADNIFFTDHTETVFKALIEILYQVRCCLFHGDLIPNADNYRVIKYCYLILLDLMEEI